MSVHVVRKGLDIPIKGRATGAAVALPEPSTVAYAPTEFSGITPKLAAREGERVKAGAPLFFAKSQPDMKFLSPVSGVVREVRRGHRRVITDIVVERDGSEEVSFKSWSLSELASITKAQAAEGLLAGGLWATLRERPLDRIARPDSEVQYILISAMETGPALPGAADLLDASDADALQAAVHVLKALAPKVVLAVQDGAAHPALKGLQGVQVESFRGPHPAGDPAVQINLIEPPVGQKRVWYLRAWDAVLIGKLFLQGRFPTERTYAAVGAGLVAPRLVRTILGAPLADLCGELAPGAHRTVRGSVLTGEAVSDDRWASFYARAVHVLPEAVERELLGWTTPQLGRFSFFRAFLSGFTKPSRDFDLRPGLFGGKRAIIPVGVYRKVVATPDIEPAFLFKSILAGDLEESIQLGLLDMSSEEAALCTYVCPSKIELDVLLRQGLEQYAKEM